jgi:hypothetical protein
VNDTDLTQGFYYDFDPQNNRSTRIYLTCDESYPDGSILVDWGRSQASASLLTIYGSATEFCARVYPTPMPVVGCDLFHNETGWNYTQDATNVWTLDLKLSDYDNATQWNGTQYWNFTLTRRQPDLDSYDALYSPCGATVSCPLGYDCDGDGEANLYLCERPTTAHIGFCTAYGLPKFDITASLLYDNMFEGVVIQYRARHTRHAHVHWRCSNTTEPGRLDPRELLAMYESQIAFEVYALEACVAGHGPTPSPSPRYPPRTPSPPAAPSPTPIASPNPIRVLSNATHYIAVDLQTLQGPWPLEMYQTVMAYGYPSEINTYWYAWDGVECSSAMGRCSGGIDDLPWNGTANLFECWVTDDYERYCHPVATKWMPGYNVSSIRQFDLDSGITIFYPGTWGTHMKITITCDPSGQRDDIGIDKDSVIFWWPDSNGQEFAFETASLVACPQHFVPQPTPTAPRPSPSPNVTMQYLVDMIGPDGKEHRLDLRDLKTNTGSVILGYGDNFYRAEIHYSPWDLVGCPDGSDCGTYQSDLANVWNCVGESLQDCFPIGDKSYGVNLSFWVESDPMSNIMARYEGGAGRFHVVFQFSCDPLLAPHEVTFSPVGAQMPPFMGSTTVFVDLAVADVCPQNPIPSDSPTPSIPFPTGEQSPSPSPQSSPPPPERKKTTGGPIFLIIVFVLAVGYFGVGALIIYFTTGTLAIPNEAFWLEVWESIMTVVLLVLTCGGDEKVKGPIYDRV